MKPILQKTSEEADHERSEHGEHIRKRLKIIGLTCIVLLAVFLVGLVIVWPQVRDWRQARSLIKAEEYERGGDYRRALLSLEQTVQLYPGNFEARRRLANFLERLGQREALAMWRDLAEAAPDAKNLTGLAGAALRFGEPKLATETLARLRRIGADGAEYYRVAAGVALLSHDNAALENALAELTKRVPADLRVKLNLAVVRLRSKDPQRAEDGRAALVELAKSDSLRIRAVVELFNDLARRWPQPSPERVQAFGQLAQAVTPPQGPRFEPRALADPVARLVSFAMRQPNPEPEDVGALLTWMILNGRAAAGFEWLEVLPPAMRSSPVVMAAASEASLQVQDWDQLRKLLEAGAWGSVPAPAIETAFDLRAARQAGIRGTAGQWASALEHSQSSLPALRALLRLTEAWHWPEEERQVLVAITRAFASETWAWRRLISIALVADRSDQVWEIYQRWTRAAPGNATVQTESAVMGLLLDRRGGDVAAALALSRAHPGNPRAVIAHALALWRNQQVTEAQAVLAGLPADTYSEPRFALARGVILADAGSSTESERILGQLIVSDLLPEERALLQRARARNALSQASGR